MKWLIAFLIFVIAAMQYRLWFGDGSLANLVSLKREINNQQEENRILSEKNAQLAAEVKALKKGDDAIEARARNNLGMIKKGETYFMIVDKTASKK